MYELALNKFQKHALSACGDLITMAEQELAAFFRAVAESFGLKEAEASADDWLHELMTTDDMPSSARQWRTLTVKASAKLASRILGRAEGTRAAPCGQHSI
jgi:hypothetical protein